jgi:hypothetical protein
VSLAASVTGPSNQPGYQPGDQPVAGQGHEPGSASGAPAPPAGLALLEPIDVNALPAGNDGVPATEDFFEGAITECGVSTDIWSNVYGYDTTKFAADAAPTTAADFIFHAKEFR